MIHTNKCVYTQTLTHTHSCVYPCLISQESHYRFCVLYTSPIFFPIFLKKYVVNISNSHGYFFHSIYFIYKILPFGVIIKYQISLSCIFFPIIWVFAYLFPIRMSRIYCMRHYLFILTIKNFVMTHVKHTFYQWIYILNRFHFGDIKKER